MGDNLTGGRRLPSEHQILIFRLQRILWAAKGLKGREITRATNELARDATLKCYVALSNVLGETEFNGGNVVIGVDYGLARNTHTYAIYLTCRVNDSKPLRVLDIRMYSSYISIQCEGICIEVNISISEDERIQIAQFLERAKDIDPLSKDMELIYAA